MKAVFRSGFYVCFDHHTQASYSGLHLRYLTIENEIKAFAHKEKMKFEIIKMIDSADTTNKFGQIALLNGSPQFHLGEFWQLAIPVTPECDAKGLGVFLSKDSPAFASTGLTAAGYINVAGTFRFRFYCATSDLVKSTGHFLNTSRDESLRSQLAIASIEAAQCLSDFEKMPIAF